MQRFKLLHCQARNVKMTRTILLAFVSTIATMFGCTKPESVNQTVVVKLNECFRPRSGNMSLCFDAVVEDSRCPKKVECIWAGRAIARFTLSANNNTHSFALTASSAMPPFAKDTILEGYKIKFTNLYPYPGDPGSVAEAEVEISQ